MQLKHFLLILIILIVWKTWHLRNGIRFKEVTIMIYKEINHIKNLYFFIHHLSKGICILHVGVYKY